MIQQVLSHYHLPLLTCAGMVLFITVFAGAVAWVLRPRSSGVYEDMSQLPLKENPHV